MPKKIGCFFYCNGCGNYGRHENSEKCSCGSNGSHAWTHTRFREGDKVTTPHGNGIVVGIDLPYSKSVWRWIVLVTKHSDKQNVLMCFFDKEVSDNHHDASGTFNIQNPVNNIRNIENIPEPIRSINYIL